MKATYINQSDLEQLLNPYSPAWLPLPAMALAMHSSTAALQPTPYIQNKWAGKEVGKIKKVGITAVVTDENLLFRVEWESPHKSSVIADNDQFVDAVAVMLPVVDSAPMMSMGAEGMPVEIWQWRADDQDGTARQIMAQGWGTSTKSEDSEISAKGVWRSNHWAVVLTRPLVSKKEGTAVLTRGVNSKFGVAVWEGSNSERAGLKSFSGNWQELGIAG